MITATRTVISTERKLGMSKLETRKGRSLTQLMKLELAACRHINFLLPGMDRVRPYSHPNSK